MRVIAAVIAVCALWISVPQLAAGAARTASQSVVPSSAPAKTPIATFGAGPANTKGPDGRSTFTYTTAPGGRLNDHIAILNLTHHVETLAIYTVDATPGVKALSVTPPRVPPEPSPALGCQSVRHTLRAFCTRSRVRPQSSPSISSCRSTHRQGITWAR